MPVLRGQLNPVAELNLQRVRSPGKDHDACNESLLIPQRPELYMKAEVLDNARKRESDADERDNDLERSQGMKDRISGKTLEHQERKTESGAGQLKSLEARAQSSSHIASESCEFLHRDSPSCSLIGSAISSSKVKASVGCMQGESISSPKSPRRTQSLSPTVSSLRRNDVAIIEGVLHKQ
jgi:hypothetical protein